MTLVSPDGWRPAATRLTELLSSGHELGDALRILASEKRYGAIFLCRAIQEACGISHGEAARAIARELTLNGIRG